jgi:acetyltransferase-like isoleucine patch superfamily enzyme
MPRVRLSKQSIQWLYDSRVLFQGWQRHGFRLRPGQLLAWPDTLRLEPYCAVYRGQQICSMGSFSYTHSPFPLDFSLGRYCSVAWDVKFPGPRHAIELLSTSLFMHDTASDIWALHLADRQAEFSNLQRNPQKPGTAIGHDVWIGQDASIMRGLRIGDGAVIAAGAMVTRDVPPYAIVGGNPARLIRGRFPPDVIEDLTELRWWRYDYPALNRINLADIRKSILDLKSVLSDTPEYAPDLVNLSEMPHDGLIGGSP